MNQAEFDELYAASFRRLTTQVHALTGDAEEARDCVQEAFVRAWAKRRTLDRADNPEAWVAVTARRLAVSRWRRIQRGRRPSDRALAPPVFTAPADASHVALVAALQRLPEDQRRALVLHHLVDLPVREVAAEVGAPEGTVKARLSRGRTALAALLDDQPGDHSGDQTGDQTDRTEGARRG